MLLSRKFTWAVCFCWTQGCYGQAELRREFMFGCLLRHWAASSWEWPEKVFLPQNPAPKLQCPVQPSVTVFPPLKGTPPCVSNTRHSWNKGCVGQKLIKHHWLLFASNLMYAIIWYLNFVKYYSNSVWASLSLLLNEHETLALLRMRILSEV